MYRLYPRKLPFLLNADRLFRETVLTTFPAVSLANNTHSALTISNPHTSVSDIIRSGLQSVLGKQTGLYFVSQMMNAALGLAVTAFLTRTLSVTDFGSYSFVVSVILFVAVFFDFGLGAAGTRLMALQNDGDQLRYRSGVLIAASLLIGLAFTAIFFGMSFLVDPIFKTTLLRVFLIVSPLVLVFPLQETIASACKGANKIAFLSLFVILPRGIYLILLALSVWLGPMSLKYALIAMILGILLSDIIAIFYLKPTLGNWKREFASLIREVREFGKDIYYGRMIDGLTNGIDKMLITFFFGVIPVGFYSIALMMTTPIGMLSRSLGTSAYKQFTRTSRISKKILVGNFIWCFTGTLLLLLLCEILIPLFFTDKYAAALGVLPYLAIGSALSGLNVPYHTFLSAQRQGRSIKIMSISTSSLFVLLSVILIPYYSVYGAAIAIVCTYGLNLIMNLYYYHLYIALHGDVRKPHSGIV